MTDFYPIIKRAVQNLDRNTIEGRRALYTKARDALNTQLRTATISSSEEEISRKLHNLDTAVRKIEAEHTENQNNHELPAPRRLPEHETRMQATSDQVAISSTIFVTARARVAEMHDERGLNSQPNHMSADVLDAPAPAPVASTTETFVTSVAKTLPATLDITTDNATGGLDVSNPNKSTYVESVISFEVGIEPSTKPNIGEYGPYDKQEVGLIVSFSDTERCGIISIKDKPDLLFRRGAFRGPLSRIASGAEVDVEISQNSLGFFATSVTPKNTGQMGSTKESLSNVASQSVNFAGYEKREEGVVKHHNYVKRFGHITIDGKPDLYFKTGAFDGHPIDLIAGLDVLVEVSKNSGGHFAASVRSKERKAILSNEQEREIEAFEQEQLRQKMENVAPGALLSNWAQIKLRTRERDGSSSFRDDTVIPRLKELTLDETWHFSYDTDQYSILRNYIRYTFYRLARENKVAFSGEYATFNTGLVDRLYDPIYAFFRKNSLKKTPYQFIDFCVAGTDPAGKRLMEKFHDLPDAAQYMSSFEEVIFDHKCTITVQWPHVVFDAIEGGRYPFKFIQQHKPAGMNWSDDPPQNKSVWLKRYVRALRNDDEQYRSIKYQIEKAIELAKKRAKWNYKTAIPSYYPAENEMSLLLPIALLSDQKPDMALVVDKVNPKVYFGVTVFPLDMAYGNARLVCRPDSDWLSPDIDERNIAEEEEEDED